MYQIVPLAEQTLSAIYQVHMVRDFPSSELKPLSAILDWMRKGRYVAVGCYQGEELLAYACLCRSLSGETLLLDYFAVVGDRRSQGVGSAFLRQLHQNFQEKEEYQGIVLEIESVESARNREEQQLRERRKQFYLRCGVEQTDIFCRIYGVDYQILFYPFRQGKSGDFVCLELDSFYRLFLTPQRYRQHVSYSQPYQWVSQLSFPTHQ